MASDKKSILIVDDEEDLRDAMAFDFTRKGFEVVTASNGQDAYKTVESRHLDLVLTDARMPNGDGLELISKIRARNGSHPPVFLVTGFADITLEQAYARGTDGVFNKPFDRKALFEQVERALLSLNDRLKGKAGESDVQMSSGLKLMNSGIVVPSSITSVGRCGIFCKLGKEFPSLGEMVEFSLDCPSASLNQVAGRGVVRFTRATGQDELPMGCGVELTYLNEKSRAEVGRWIEAHPVKALIPKV